MSKYLVLYHSEGALHGISVSEMIAKTPPEQMQAGMALWGAWHAKAGSAIRDPGAPLDNSVTVTQGSSAVSPTTITGYAVLEAPSMDEAVALIAGHPHFHMPGASVQILEAVAMPGM